MFPSRDATIKHSTGSVVISTFAKRPTVELLVYLSWVIPWLAFAVLGLLSVCGQLSPETMTVGIRCFLATWLAIWIVGGGYFIRSGFLRAFSRLELLADSTGILLDRSSPLGASSRKYPWGTVDYVSEYLQDGRSYGGVVMRVDERLVTIDDRLPRRVAASIADALGSILTTSKKANMASRPIANSA